MKVAFRVGTNFRISIVWKAGGGAGWEVDETTKQYTVSHRDSKLLHSVEQTSRNGCSAVNLSKRKPVNWYQITDG